MKWNAPVLEGIYRYVLPFRLSATAKELAVIQINPSLADGKRLDPTVGKVKKWAEEKGYGIVYFLNLFAIVSPKQEIIEVMDFDLLVGPKNNSFISGIPSTSDIIIATGKPKGPLAKFYEKRKTEILGILNDRELLCVGDLTEGRYPRHGRMWNQTNRELRKLKWK